MHKSRIARGASALLLATALGALAAVPAEAEVRANRYVKSVDLTVDGATSVELDGDDGQCFISRDGYNIDFDAKDYPSLGTGGSLASGGPGPATPAAKRSTYAAFTARIDGVGYVLDDADGYATIRKTVKLNVKKRTITFDEYPIVEVGAAGGDRATVSGVVKCKPAAVH